MANSRITTVSFEEYKTPIKEGWVPDFVDWVLAELDHWIDRQLEMGNDGVRELKDIDLAPARDRIIENDIKKFENGEATIVGVVDDGSFVGGVYTDVLDETTAKINRLWLPAEYRGQGIGKELVDSAIDIANERDVAVIHLSTAPFMDTAQSIYADFGFEYRNEPFPSSTVPDPLTEYWNFMELEL